MVYQDADSVPALRKAEIDRARRNAYVVAHFMIGCTGSRGGSWGALERRNYRLFVAGQLISLIGTWTQSVAQSWLVYRLTGSALWLGLVIFCQQAPAFFLASFGGLLGDHYPRRNVLVVTQS